MKRLRKYRELSPKSHLTNNYYLTSTNRLLLCIFSLHIALNLAQAINNIEKCHVIISFDDGYFNVFKYAFPILKKYDVPCTIALIASYLKDGLPRVNAGPLTFMNIGEVWEMKVCLNIEIASHSMTHQNLTKLDMKDRQYELVQSKYLLDSIFNQTTITFVYPYGLTNTQVIVLTKAAGYQLGRSTRWGEPNLWVDRYQIPIKEVRTTTTPAEILSHIRNHKTTVLLFHRILPEPAHFTEYSHTSFDSLIKMLKSDDKIQLLTLKDLYQQWWQDIMAKHIAQHGWLTNPILFQKIDVDNTRTLYPHISQ